MTDEMLRELGKQLPHDRPDVDRREHVRAQILAAAAAPARPSPRRWLLVGGGFAAGALAAAAIAIVLVRPHGETAPAPAHEAYARIESSSAAELEHTLVPTATGTDELVRVRAGTIKLAVPPTRTGDRVRVTTGDAEIEGSGAYEVVVAADALASVTVTSGTATLRLAHPQQAVFLAAGQSWRAQVQTADLTSPATDQGSPIETDLAPTPSPSPTPTATDRGSPIETDPAPTAPSKTRRAASAIVAEGPRTPVTSAVARTTDEGTPIETELAAEPAKPPVQAMTNGEGPRPAVVAPPGNETERHFRAGWSALRANKLAEAVIELAAAADSDGPLSADARYYQAVALIRAKRGAEAERALVQFLDRSPASTRRGRAAIMLGRLIADRGDAAGARAWFELAAKDPDPTVAAAAAAALK